MSRVRRPAVAGHFYPAEPDRLAKLVDSLLDAAARPAVPPAGPLAVPSAGPAGPPATVGGAGEALAYVVPHAGYAYSGATAARCYAALRPHADRIRRVVLLGPSHRVPLAGCAVPAATAWATPLGAFPVDVAGVERLVRDGHATVDDAPHAAEHSLEVQLPFLRRIAPEAPPILPVAVGSTAVDDVAVTVTAVAEAGTVVLCSTDLSHYLDLATARVHDGRTIQAVLDLAPERIGSRDACGVFALRGVVAWAGHAGLAARLLHRATSADSSGDPARVVGYAALAFSPEPAAPPATVGP